MWSGLCKGGMVAFPLKAHYGRDKKMQFDLGEKKEFHFFSSFSTYTLFL